MLLLLFNINANKYERHHNSNILCIFSLNITENCLPTSLSDKETVGLVEVEKGIHGQCINKQPIRGFTECHGSCDSGTKYNRITLKQDKRCHCCSIASYDELKIPVNCVDEATFEIFVSVPKTCSCKPCDEEELHKATTAFELLKQVSKGY